MHVPHSKPIHGKYFSCWISESREKYLYLLHSLTVTKKELYMHCFCHKKQVFKLEEPDSIFHTFLEDHFTHELYGEVFDRFNVKKLDAFSLHPSTENYLKRIQTSLAITRAYKITVFIRKITSEPSKYVFQSMWYWRMNLGQTWRIFLIKMHCYKVRSNLPYKWLVQQRIYILYWMFFCFTIPTY